jgi:superfamily II DNA/RNA helicase
MLDMGFYDSIEEIIMQAPERRQTLLFSATYPVGIKQLASKFMRNPQQVKAEAFHDDTQIEQRFYEISPEERMSAVTKVLGHFRPASCVAFCFTKQQVQETVDHLTAKGISAVGLHGDLEQRDRDQVLAMFANRSTSVLVATDVAARGLDIKDVPAVFNFDVPFNPEDYVHRIGRTGRAGASGLAVTLVSPGDSRLTADLEKLLKRKVEIEPLEFDDERPRGRINDGRRAWREQGDDDDRPARYDERRRDSRPAPAPKDPFFDQPYEAPQREEAPAWEAGAKPAGGRISANIKPKRKVAALFKSVQ